VRLTIDLKAMGFEFACDAQSRCTLPSSLLTTEES